MYRQDLLLSMMRLKEDNIVLVKLTFLYQEGSGSQLPLFPATPFYLCHPLTLSFSLTVAQVEPALLCSLKCP